MKVQINIVLFSILLLCINCKKETAYTESAIPIANYNQELLAIVAECDDTSAFKSDLDLKSLWYLEDCYLCNSVKEVPGLGTISWTANTAAGIGNNTIGIYFSTYFPWGNYMFLREDLHFVLPFSVGIYQVDNAYYGRITADGDVWDGDWKIDANCFSFVEITQLDLDCKEVRGVFELHFIQDEPSALFQYSERINFLNGKFEARILQY